MAPNPVATHTNNFDFLRLLFATFVLITHSFAVLGLPEQDVLWQFSSGKISLSALAVGGFFTLSGLLITKSLRNAESLGDYYWKRAIRILPGFWTVLAVAVAAGFFISGKSLSDYLHHYTTRYYLGYGAIFHLQYEVDGVFQHNAIHSLNNSLWTLPAECIAAYGGLSLLYPIRKKTTLMLVIMSVVFLILFSLAGLRPDLLSAQEHTFFNFRPIFLTGWMTYFAAGSIWALAPIKWSDRNLNVLGWASLAAFLLGMHFTAAGWLQYLLLPLAIIPLGSLRYPLISELRRLGDFSYGTYLYGWPVQQFIVYFLHPSYTTLVLLCIPISWLFGYASWKVVEEPFLRLKPKRVR